VPVQHRILHEQRLVVAEAHGHLRVDELFAYQRNVWSDKLLKNYRELLDLGGVESLGPYHVDDLKGLADLARTSSVATQPTKTAVVAPTDLLFGLSRMYEAYRHPDLALRAYRVFRELAEARAWLEAEEPPEAHSDETVWLT
jgi:hypothetical protein